MNYLWKFPSIYFHFFGWRRNRFCHRISVVLNISSHTSASRFSNWIVMLLISKIVTFDQVVIEKKAQPFLSSLISFFSLLFILNRLAHIWIVLFFLLQGWTVGMSRLGRFKSIWTVPYFQLQGWTSIYNFEPRKQAFFDGFLVLENKFLVVENQTCFFRNFAQWLEGPVVTVATQFTVAYKNKLVPTRIEIT